MDLDPAALQVGDRYRLLIGAIVPRPIAFVSTSSPAGQLNLAPFSFFSGVGSSPMSLVFCPVNKPDGSEKDTLRNCAPPEAGGVGEFVVNIAHEQLIRRVAAAGADLPYGSSEFELAGLTAHAWEGVLPPRVAECAVAFACRTHSIIRLNPGAAGGGNLVIGEVFRVHVDDALLDSRLRIDQSRLAAVGRMGGYQYCRTTERFELAQGSPALSAELPFPAL
ncbi:MAG TPA: flavin reductase family protein [Phycisphaerales bacterium]|nr:flavin reductase family protein [Phycisphaerales bacterium]